LLAVILGSTAAEIEIKPAARRFRLDRVQFKRARGSDFARRRRTYVEIQAAGIRLRLRGRFGATADVEVKRRRRCGGRGGCGRGSSTVKTIAGIDGATQRHRLVPLGSGAVGQALELERGLLEVLGVLAAGVDLQELGV